MLQVGASIRAITPACIAKAEARRKLVKIEWVVSDLSFYVILCVRSCVLWVGRCVVC